MSTSARPRPPRNRAGPPARTRRPSMDERIADRRRVVAQQAQRRRRRRTVIVVVVLLLAGGVTALAFSPVLAVSEIRVAGVEGPRADHIRRMVNVAEGSPILKANTSRSEERVLGVPWVAQAEVTRDFPTVLNVDVEPRAPVILVDEAGEHWQIDADGVVVAAGTIDGLPVIETAAAILPPEGEEVRDAALSNVLAVHTGLQESLSDQIVRYEAAGPRGARAWYVPSSSESDGVWIRFGDADRVERKGEVTELLLDQIQTQQEARGGAGLADVAEVDVRAPDNPVVIPASD